jgi:hypothetical protein
MCWSGRGKVQKTPRIWEEIVAGVLCIDSGLEGVSNERYRGLGERKRIASCNL